MPSLPKKILISDTNKDILDTVTIILQSYDYTVKAYSDYKTLASEIESFKPHLILLEIFGLGDETCNICKQIKKFKVPVVLFSTLPNSLMKAKELNLDGVIEKPFDIDNLLFTVESLLNRPAA